MFGTSENLSFRSKKKFMGLASALDMVYDDPSKYEIVIDAASQLRNMLKGEHLSLSMNEKVRVLKSVTRAKVRAFMGGNADGYRTFKTLDTISSDLVQLL